jgi:hypothetical protein
MGTSAHCQDAELPTSIVSLVVESVELILALTCAVCVVVTPKETNSSRPKRNCDGKPYRRGCDETAEPLNPNKGSSAPNFALRQHRHAITYLLLKSRYCRGLPREARELCNLNCLGKRLGKLDPIEFQYVSASTPKPLGPHVR